jgi:hypothetical protein
MRKALLVLIAAALLVGTADALAYPKVLFDAVQKTYAPKKVRIESVCHEQINSRLYVLVDVEYIKSGRARKAAFQYTRAGWFGIWKDGAIRLAVAKSQRPRVRAVMKELHRFCGS